MSMNDPIADMLTRIRNAAMARIKNIELQSSKMKLSIANLLKEEGYIDSFVTKVHEHHRYLLIDLKYDKNENAVIHGLQKISKPGRRVYAQCAELPRILNNYGTLIVSTSHGIITGKKAQRVGVGGELICSIW